MTVTSRFGTHLEEKGAETLEKSWVALVQGRMEVGLHPQASAVSEVILRGPRQSHLANPKVGSWEELSLGAASQSFLWYLVINAKCYHRYEGSALIKSKKYTLLLK